MTRTIAAFENGFIFATWLLLAILQIVVLPVHMVSMLITRGCDGVVAYVSEIQSIAVEKLKAGK